MEPDLYCCIPAYNEESRIERCLDSISEQNFQGELETIVCLNGCTDQTEGLVVNAQKKHPRLGIQIIHSDKGIAFAQNAIVDYVRHKDVPLFFVDADVTIDDECANILYDELSRNDSLIVAGAWPVPEEFIEGSLWESVLYRVLHVRAHHPESEISINDVSAFKQFVDEHPQSSVSPEFERRSKTYFHGRAFMVRNADSYKIPTRHDVCDDTYMPNFIHTEHGPGTIRTRYDARVFYSPYLSLREHFNTYRRIYLDLRHLDMTQSEFRESREMEQTRLDWQYIFSQNTQTIASFIAFATLTRVEYAAYKLLPKKGLEDMWIYKKK